MIETVSQSADVHIVTTCDSSGTPNELSYQDNSNKVDHTLAAVDPNQIDVYSSTPCYKIHFLGHEPAAAPEEVKKEGNCEGWAQGASEAEPGQGESRKCIDTEQIPESVSELQPSMALLGAYPYSTVMPQGTCMWDWHTDCIQSVSVHSVCRLTGLSDNIHMLTA